MKIWQKRHDILESKESSPWPDSLLVHPGGCSPVSWCNSESGQEGSVPAGVQMEELPVCAMLDIGEAVDGGFSGLIWR